MQSSPPENHAWHQREVQDLAQEHLVDPALGLHEAEALLRSERHGANELQASRKRAVGVKIGADGASAKAHRKALSAPAAPTPRCRRR